VGWSYNRDPAAKTPMGVSEYVVRPGVRISDVKSTPAAQFRAR
jgi:hypothetical protein